MREGPPPGFEEQETETLYVDVYYQRKFIISTKATIDRGKIKFLNPEAIIKQLPEIKEDKIEGALGELAKFNEFNTEYSCKPEMKSMCDMLNSDLITVIYNPDTFTAEIIANSEIFLRKENNGGFLDPQSNDFAQFFRLNAVGYWSDDKTKLPDDYVASSQYYNSTNQELYNFYVNSKTSLGGATLNTDITYNSTKENVYFDKINVSKYFKLSTLRVGEFYTSDLRNMSQSDLLGISYRSSINRRRKDSDLFASPLSLYLNYRSRVNIMKDGRIYSSQYYDSGNQELNTNSLPTGSYNVEIEIIEPNGNVRRERQFFVKNGELPPSDQPYFWLEFGAIRDYDADYNIQYDKDSGAFNHYTGEYLARLGVYKKIFGSTGIGSNLMLNEDISGAEIFVDYFGNYFSAKTSFAMDTKNDYGYTIYAQTENVKNLLIFLSWTQNFLDKKSLDKHYDYRPISSYSRQGSASIKYYFNGDSDNLGISGNYYKDSFYKNESYSVGPVVELNFNRIRSINMKLTLSAYKTNRDYQALLNFTLNFSSKYVQLYENATYRYTKERDGEKDSEDHFDSSTALTFQDGGIFNNDARFTLRYDDVQNTETKSTEFDYKSGVGRFTADASGNKYLNQYSLNYSSIFAFNRKNAIFGGREPKDSAVAIKIDGGNRNQLYDVYLNQSKIDFARGDSTRTVTINSFDEYNISIQPQDSTNSYIENSRIKTITTYPGSVDTIEYKVKNIVTIIGTLYSSDENPIPNSKMKGEIDETRTDDGGYFQITTIIGETLKIGKFGEFIVSKELNKENKSVLFMDIILDSDEVIDDEPAYMPPAPTIKEAKPIVLIKKPQAAKVEPEFHNPPPEKPEAPADTTDNGGGKIDDSGLYEMLFWIILPMSVAIAVGKMYYSRRRRKI